MRGWRKLLCWGNLAAAQAVAWVYKDDFIHNKQVASLPGDKAHLNVTYEHDVTIFF